jgi:Peroxidase
MKISDVFVILSSVCLQMLLTNTNALVLPIRMSSMPLERINIEDRRKFIGTIGATTSFWVMGSRSIPPVGATSAFVDYKNIASDIAQIVAEDQNKGPTLVRLAWHSSGTYDKMSKTGGSSGGTIRFSEELAHGGNAGLGVTAVPWLEGIHKAHPDISYADLYTLAGGKSLFVIIYMRHLCHVHNWII